MNFELNLALVLGHTLLLETKDAYSPGGVVDDAMGGGDPYAPKPGESTAQTMQAFIKYLPQMMATILPQVTPAAQASLGAAQATSPQMSQLQADMYKNIAPQLNDVSQQMDASNKMAGSAADLAVLQGPGAASARAVQQIDQENNPQFYATRDAANTSIGNLMSGQLTPAETEAINRRLGQDNFARGLMGTPTATSTVSNAMQFGDASRNRQMQGVQAATSFLPASRAPIDPTQVALGRPSSGSGASQFLGVNQNAGGAAMDQSTNLLNQIAGFQNNAMQINSQRRDSLDRMSGVLSSLPT